MSPWLGRVGVTLAAFLAARLDEDQAAASTRLDHDLRPMREVAAKRAILELHLRAHNQRGDTLCFTCAEGPWPCLTVRHLAAVYSDLPDYDPDWSTASCRNRKTED